MRVPAVRAVSGGHEEGAEDVVAVLECVLPAGLEPGRPCAAGEPELVSVQPRGMDLPTAEVMMSSAGPKTSSNASVDLS